MEHYFCNDELKQRIQGNLHHFESRFQQANGYKQAAVALTIVDIADDPGVNGISLSAWPSDTAALILTRRSSQLKNHTGQWALPGGRIDKKETVEAAALRELKEEVGIHLEDDHIMGRLDDFVTRSGFIISPVVIWGGEGLTMSLNPSEVSSVHRIPVKEFTRADAPMLDKIPHSANPVLHMPVGNSFIASPTGALLYQFREVAILGRHTRVAHYEQPYFAWQ